MIKQKHSLRQVAELLERKLQQHQLTHLGVAIEGNNVIIYSEQRGQTVHRAILCRFGNQFILGLADPRGEWQPTSYIGTPSELFEVLTRRLGFPLARWPN